MENVVVVFDIGKTNKKVLVFNGEMSLLFQHEQKFITITDEDGFECDDIEKIEKWILTQLKEIVSNPAYNVRAVNFTTYGATLVYTDKDGKRLTPVYNYLKPMPNGILDNFYESYDGIDEFSRKTASPALGMLNSGLQALWLKRSKPEVFAELAAILHLPQYLCFSLTKMRFSEYTSIGCHTAMWDFDLMQYHKWCNSENLTLPNPVSNNTLVGIEITGKKIECGIGIHDSSAAIAPYILCENEKFALISTGTWCICMNPFNNTPLTTEQLAADCLCYMSIDRKPVKSSRLFMGHIHDVNVELFSKYFNVNADLYKSVNYNAQTINENYERFAGYSYFFENGVPDNYLLDKSSLLVFGSFEEAYHQLIADLAVLTAKSLELVLTNDVKKLYISGGFARNQIYLNLMSEMYKHIDVFTSEIDNASAIGAAMVVWDAMPNPLPVFNLGEKYSKTQGFNNEGSILTHTLPKYAKV